MPGVEVWRWKPVRGDDPPALTAFRFGKSGKSGFSINLDNQVKSVYNNKAKEHVNDTHVPDFYRLKFRKVYTEKDADGDSSSDTKGKARRGW